MADELDLELDQFQPDVPKEHPIDKRLNKAFEKIKTVEEEKLAAQQKAESEATRATSLQKEVEFLNSFGDQLTKYPEASSFKDQIKEKVLKGYSVEDATISTLASQGKFAPKETVPENVAGGSASVNQPITGGAKKIAEMTREEKRTALLEAEQRGEIFISN